MTTHHFSDLDSHGVHPKVATANRLDPYWDGLWASGSTASWVNVESARRQVSSGLATMPWYLDMTQEQAREIFFNASGWRRRLEAYGALGSWRTLSAEQLAAFTGAPSMAGRNRSMNAAFNLGLADLGIFTTGLVSTSIKDRARLFRPAALGAFDRILEPELTYPEKVLVSGGYRYTGGGQFDRHNLLTAELGLRVAEFLPNVGTILGESLSGIDLLAGTGLGLEEKTKQRRSADATLIRDDGMRVVVEMTASVTPYFSEKVRRWVHLLATTTLSHSGITVLFVGAPKPDRTSQMKGASEFRAQMKQAVREAVREFPGISGSNPHERIGVALWEDFFPEPGMVDEDFLDLTVEMVGAGGSGWLKQSLWNLPLDPLRPGFLTAVIDNAAATASPPVWLRRGRSIPDLYKFALHQTGIPEGSTPSALTVDRLSNHPTDDEGGNQAASSQLPVFEDDLNPDDLAPLDGDIPHLPPPDHTQTDEWDELPDFEDTAAPGEGDIPVF